MAPKVVIMMADYGHDPTETTVPYSVFCKHGFHVCFATESGRPPVCDRRLTDGLTQKLLGARASTVAAYRAMAASEACQHPLSWTAADFSLDGFDLVFFPGGHDKAVRQVLDSARVHSLVGEYFPKTGRASVASVASEASGASEARKEKKEEASEARTEKTQKVVGARNETKGEACEASVASEARKEKKEDASEARKEKKQKVVGAVCHGVMVLSASKTADGTSVLHDVETTALPAGFEQAAFWGTRAFLGDYYKTYGAGSETVEDAVKKVLDSPKQWKSSLGLSPFIVEDPTYNYVSGRYPADAQKLAERLVELVQASQ